MAQSCESLSDDRANEARIAAPAKPIITPADLMRLAFLLPRQKWLTITVMIGVKVLMMAAATPLARLVWAGGKSAKGVA